MLARTSEVTLFYRAVTETSRCGVSFRSRTVANPEHLAKLNEGVEAWNQAWQQWVNQNRRFAPDFSGADLSKADLTGANLSLADLSGANLSGAKLIETSLVLAHLRTADLRNADLGGAHLHNADLSGANLSGATLFDADLGGVDLSGAKLTETGLGDVNLRGAKLRGADLGGVDLSGANLRGANLRRATLVHTNLEGADLTACSVYGISAWDLKLEGAIQSNLEVRQWGSESWIQVDNLEVAQFIYLLLHNEKIRHVIDTITSKVVLILGRFTLERKIVLDALREELRKRDYLPILFDFEKPAGKDLTGTVSTLANLAHFIIADLTEPSSVPHELATVVPGTVVPVQTILLEGQREYAMFPDLVRRYHWVLEPYQYTSKELLIASLNERVIAPAEAKAKQIARK